MSKGENIIARLLNGANVEFEREKTFTDLRAGRYRFDFYCPNVNGAPAIIELNGAQHYQQIGKFHKTVAEFHKGQEHDRRKISYCLANKIKIYCIPYWDLEQLKRADDLFRDRYLARNRWHNDEVWALHKFHQR